MSLSQLPFQVKAKIIKLYKQTNPDCPRLYDTLINVRVWHEALLSVYWKHTYIASMKTTDEEGEQGQGSRGWRRLDNFFAYGWRYVECLHLVDGCEQPTSEGTPELDIPLLQDKLDFLNNHKLPHLRAVTIPNVTLEFYITNLDGFLQSHKDDFEEIGVLKLLSEAVEAPLLISECAFEIFSRFRFTNLRKVFSDVAIQAAYLSDIVNLFPSSLTCLYLSEVVIDSIEDILEHNLGHQE
ncbi:hypothetical protein EV182_003818 [Spiromyces aspiralis]|uniref:Uncharacterized protein n=1 Tax=Spiromyces aspiralis TaxID=68401 RepID=A0ACC1HRB2_9FUNG|nr:hypothetical protein EV182_003818 [Spiromyces aspiralis]